SDFRPTVDNKPPSKGKNRTGIIVGVIVGLGLLSILTGVGIFIIRKRRKPYTDDEGTNSNGSVFFKNLTSRGPVDKKVIQWLLSLHQIDQDVGYCQGMSDLCSPMIVLLEDEADSFFCFERLMRRLRGNFRSTGRSVGVEAQLTHLSSITQIIDPKLHQHLGDYLCAIRMLMVQFRREFSFCDSLYLWEMMWALEYDPDLFHVYEAHQCGSEKVEVSNGKPKSMSQCGKYERQNMRNGGKSTEGPLPISVFLVASVLKDKSSKLMTEARGLDDVVKILNDMSGNLDAKKTCSGAIKIHKKYLRKVISKFLLSLWAVFVSLFLKVLSCVVFSLIVG
ncbi:unnamed protein product, partial [Brassica napus]